MKIGNPDRPVTSAWLTKEGHRLDAPPFLSGAVEARVLLDKLTVSKQPLREVTAGHNGGIYNGPQFKRNYVTSPEHGVPFLTGSSILLADASRLPMISRKDALSKKLAYLRVEEGMTLISCSGSIGKMAYARPELAGVWASQDVMKVVPNPEVILPGYLYAYLSSRFGKTLVTSGTYGAIIQHIEPEHIADLHVPRFGSEFEADIHNLVSRAGSLRSECALLLKECADALSEEINIEMNLESRSPNIGLPSSSEIIGRMDAMFHSQKHITITNQIKLDRHFKLDDLTLGIMEPPRIKRNIVEEGGWSVPFFGTSAIMNSEPEPSYFVGKSKTSSAFMIKDDHILLPRSGQLAGIIGWPILPIGMTRVGAVSEDAIRIIMPNTSQAGYVFLFLRSHAGQIQLKSRAFGSSIPHLNTKEIGQVLIPWPSDQYVEMLGGRVFRAIQMQDEAIRLDTSARQLVERAIEQNYVPPEV